MKKRQPRGKLLFPGMSEANYRLHRDQLALAKPRKRDNAVPQDFDQLAERLLPGWRTKS